MLRPLVTDVLAPYQEILTELRGLDVQWHVAAGGKGGIRSKDGRCPLKELWYRPREEVGLAAGQLFTFTSAADGCYQNHSETLREAILEATIG